MKYNSIFHRVKYKEDRILFSNAVQRSNQQPEEEGDLETYLHVYVILFK